MGWVRRCACGGWRDRGEEGAGRAGNIYFNLEDKDMLQLPGFGNAEAKAQPSKAVLSHRLLNNYF